MQTSLVLHSQVLLQHHFDLEFVLFPVANPIKYHFFSKTLIMTNLNGYKSLTSKYERNFTYPKILETSALPEVSKQRVLVDNSFEFPNCPLSVCTIYPNHNGRLHATLCQ